jgi:hypothetical protein
MIVRLLALAPLALVVSSLTPAARLPEEALPDAEFAAPKPVTRIIAQPDAPLEITGYTASYAAGGRYSDRGISHDLQYRSRSQPVVAVRFGLVAFDIFNRFLDYTGGIDMDEAQPGKVKTGAWTASAYAAFSFHTGVAYVSTVRFADGTIWTADEAAITSELRKIEADFDAKRLEDAPPPVTLPGTTE